jgi:protein-disulfide isomerase
VKPAFALAALAMLALPAGAAPVRHRPAAHHAAPAARDWTKLVVATPEGGFRMGNPAAKVKLVEYGSLSCPYCARFDREGVPALRNTYVRSGRVSWEYRTYLNHPTDPAAAALAHCNGPANFFAIADQLYATQKQWYGRLVAYGTERYRKLQDLPVARRNAEIAHITGLDTFFEQHGMSAPRVQACLSDRAVLDKLAAIVELGNRDGIQGTPGFTINGKVVDNAFDWGALEPRLKEAVR